VAERFAFLILVHKDPLQGRRFVERLRHPDVDIFIHVDAKFDSAPFAMPGVVLLDRRFVVSWGGFGAMRVCLEWFKSLERRADYSRFAILSGQDYPLKPIDEIVEANRKLDGECLDLAWSGENHDYRYDVFWVHPSELPIFRRFKDRILRKFWYRHRHTRRLPNGMEFACGSAFWNFSRQGVAHILSRVGEQPELVRFFENTLISDEMFFHILLWNSPLRNRIIPSTHYVDWTIRGEHPKMLGAEDVEAMLSSGALFARKFEQDAPVLDELDRRLRWKDGSGASVVA
jgi:hypothetical protein